MNCRTHEHRHFERTLRSTDTIPGPRLAEGRFTTNHAACAGAASRGTAYERSLSVRPGAGRKRERDGGDDGERRDAATRARATLVSSRHARLTALGVVRNDVRILVRRTTDGAFSARPPPPGDMTELGVEMAARGMGEDEKGELDRERADDRAVHTRFPMREIVGNTVSGSPSRRSAGSRVSDARVARASGWTGLAASRGPLSSLFSRALARSLSRRSVSHPRYVTCVSRSSARANDRSRKGAGGGGGGRGLGIVPAPEHTRPAPLSRPDPRVANREPTACPDSTKDSVSLSRTLFPLSRARDRGIAKRVTRGDDKEPQGNGTASSCTRL